MHCIPTVFKSCSTRPFLYTDKPPSNLLGRISQSFVRVSWQRRTGAVALMETKVIFRVAMPFETAVIFPKFDLFSTSARSSNTTLALKEKCLYIPLMFPLSHAKKNRLQLKRSFEYTYSFCNNADMVKSRLRSLWISQQYINEQNANIAKSSTSVEAARHTISKSKSDKNCFSVPSRMSCLQVASYLQREKTINSVKQLKYALFKFWQLRFF